MEAQDGNAAANTEGSKAYTYHCLCSQLILSSSLPISQSSRRAGEGLDKAHMVSLLPSRNESDDEEEPLENLFLGLPSTAGVAMLLNSVLDNKPIVVRREDGFEKRYLQRCARCRLIIGYQLDKSQYDGFKSFGRREDVVYILPGAVMSTEEMVQGKDMGLDIGFKASTV